MAQWPTESQAEWERARGQRETEILDQARQVMRESGEVSLAQVARGLGIQPPSLYEYFPGKAAIYDALYVMAFREFEAYVHHALVGPGSFWEAIAAGIRSYWRFALERPALFSIGFQRPPAGFEPSGVSVAIRRVILERVRGSLLEKLREAELGADISPDMALELLAAAGHGLTLTGISAAGQAGGDRERVEGLISTLVESFRNAWHRAENGRPKLNAWGLPE
jgi:AcrR family transcriptional regulator